MGRLKKFIIGAGTLLAVIGTFAGVSFAMNANQIVSGVTNHSIYKSAQTITITGTVNGDIFCVAQTVDIDATVNGDVICAGQTVTVNGTVHGSVRLAGQTVSLGAKVDHDASIVAQQSNFDSIASIGRDAGIFAQSALVNSSIGRDLQATGSSLTLNSYVGRDVNANVNTLNLQSSSAIARNLSYSSPNKLTQESKSKVNGKIYYSYASNAHHTSWAKAIFGFQIFLLFAFLILGLVLVALFPQYFAKSNKTSSERIWVVFAIGIVALVFVPVIIAVLLFSTIGIPLAFLLAALWFMALLLSAPLSAFYVGRLILSGKQSALLVILVGSLVLGLISLIPFLGELIVIIAVWFGTGSLLLNLKYQFKKPEYKIN